MGKHRLTGQGHSLQGVCIYNTDERSQAFKRWYLHQETEADIALLGPEYRRQ